MRRLLASLALVSCGRSQPAAPPTEPRAEPGLEDPIARALGDEPSVECADPVVAAEAPPPLEEPDPRGYVAVDQLVFRAGCVPPAELTAAITAQEASMLDCVHDQVPDMVTFIARLAVDRAQVTVTTREVPADPAADDAPVTLDHPRLSSCLTRALSGLAVPAGAAALTVDVVLSRGHVVEARSPMFTPSR